VEWVYCDIRDPLGLEDAMAGVDAVIHAAAKVSFLKKDRRELLASISTALPMSSMPPSRNRFRVSSMSALWLPWAGRAVVKK
jgi:dihydroflavonol-4-reductase